jgi:DNA processing protein
LSLTDIAWDRDELNAWLRLTLTPGVGNAKARALLSAFGLPQAIFEQSNSALRAVVSTNQADALLSEPPQLPVLLQTTLDWLALAVNQPPRRLLTLADAAYPAELLRTDDPPLLLYTLGHGDLADLASRGIAIVGSRNPTPQGKVNAKRFGSSLVQAGLTVVSGLALGIDGAAHEGALEGAQVNAMATVAVVGTGLDRVYPKQHLALAHRIALQGLLVSEYPLGTPPLPANFPKRNRIIAALSLGTLVVEAALKSGSLITARQALEQGKEVYAIPGSIHTTQARGCHWLIRQGAKLVESAQDVLEELNLPTSTTTKIIANLPDRDCGNDQKDPMSDQPLSQLLDRMGYDPLGLDGLIARTGYDAATLQAYLLELELAGHVARLPGGQFQRIASA